MYNATKLEVVLQPNHPSIAQENIMRNSILFYLFFSLFLVLPDITFAQVKAIASGDAVTLQTFDAKQTGNNPITFSPKSTYTYKVLIEENGDRKFLRAGGFVTFAHNRLFTTIVWLNKPTEPNRQFLRFPQDKQLQPGMTWVVPVWTTSTSCGDIAVNFTATSANGPEIDMTIDGKNTKIQTTSIHYEGFLTGCNATWIRTHEVLYSSELNEIVSTKVINYTGGSGKTFLYGGDGWAITAITTAGK